ncbi:PaaX family transcriptional regulator C-terminal domain-containing protein [Pseudoponticoccus marisrubri]|uniref:PaaX family transcriptional regulator n=1 Tax=Pseudoponticoccus marisrubri TaxID=1685382 RepID=A0A0W7WKI3_9RHOB|nr:PaaX family transcriptional regulator C-terminal domain-containing protein [Pseudoponticoccus marisrubri]KUF11117.1 hypothetical protein AVJ23_08665 [Pseudoponticoccus marisrubri]
MHSETSPVFSACAAALAGPRQPRVWSVIITIFGDLAQAPGDTISGAVLSRITELAGIKPEAQRVALHRLRKDGWIESARVGRLSHHRLTAFGRALSAEATPRIYAERIDPPARWHVLIAGGEEAAREALDAVLLTGDYISVSPQAALGPGPVPEGCADLLSFDTARFGVPDWARERVFPADLRAAYDRLHDALREVAESLGPAPVLAPLEAATLRMLVVHNWRRLVLKHPEVPREFYPEGWSGEACRAEVARILSRVPRPGLEQLDGTDSAA